jgi:hypothetical protein
MDRLKRFALKKVADGLDKALEAKAHFDKKEEKKSYTKKIVRLKEILTDTMFHGEEKEKSEAYTNVQLLNRIQTEHEIMTADKKAVDELWKRYGD